MTNNAEICKLRNQIRYDPDTGNFYWLKTVYDSVSNTFHGVVDPEAEPVKANKMSSGYLQIKAGAQKHLAHRLAWVLATGKWPSKHLDHINGARDDNRLCNLRECTEAENAQNLGMYSSNTSGYTGVSWNKRTQRWYAYINVAGKQINLGCYLTPEEAHRAYLEAKKIHHTFQPVPR
uniref:HNH endonuclease n=1 Tax=Xanthomonas phage MK21 TaxID=3148942 RepID=A0AAU7J825_9CAUD